MLTHFAVKNFKSFQSAELELRPLTVLIGANASGKTNLLEALQLLSWMASGRQLSQIFSAVRDDELALRGTLPQLTYEGNDEDIEFSCTISDVQLWLNLTTNHQDGARISFEMIRTSAQDTESPPLYYANVSGEGYTLDIRYNNFARGGRTNTCDQTGPLSPRYCINYASATTATKFSRSPGRCPSKTSPP